MNCFAVFYGSIIAKHYKHDGMATFIKWAEAQEFAEHMNMAADTDKYFVARVSIKAIKESKCK
jgi:hypothetical protein